MVEPSTLPLELLVLFLSAGALALSGILAGLLIEPAGRRPKPPHPQLRLRPLLRELVLPPVLATLVATLVLAGLVQAASLRIGSSHDVELALAVGAFGGLAVALFAIGVTILIPRAATERPVDLLTDRRPRRGWTASAAISSGAGGAALLTLIGLYVTLDGHVPAMIAAALGAAAAALAARTVGRPRRNDAAAPPGSAHQLEWIRSMAPTSVAYAIDLYLAFLTAATGASLIAFVPSAIRILQPNAVLFPMAALAAVFVASLVAIPFGAGVPSPSGSFRRIAELGPVAFGTIALLALVPPYLPGGLGLYLSGVTGLAAGTLVVLLWAAGGSSPRTRTRGSLRYLRAVVPAIVLAGTIAVTYWLASWELPRGVDLSTPGLGTYGIALAAVAMVGTFAGLMALDLGGRFAAALNAAGEATPASATRISPASLAETPDPGTDRFTAGVRVGLVLAMGLASLVLVTGFLSLVPLEAGVAPGTLVVSLTGGTEGRLLVGAALGLLIPVLTATVLSYREAPLTPGAPSSPAVDPIRLRLGRSIGPLLLGIGIPVLAGSTLGAAGLVGVVLGALLGTLWHGFSSEILLLGPAEGGPPQILVPTMALAVLTALAFGAALYSGSFAGAL